MKTNLVPLLAGLCLFAGLASQAQAQDQNDNRPMPQNDDAGPRATDPQRWYVDDATRQEQLRTLRKEIGAALQEAQKQCQAMAASERDGCLKDARNTYQHDMSNIEQLREAAHPPS
jgi:TolA-binding protein